MIGDVIDGADELASAVTSALGPGGSAALTATLIDALEGAWAEFFGAANPPGDTNWQAYSHRQLYDMVWQDADVADVGAVAAEWARHGSALTGVAGALRGQGTALRSNWQGPAAELAADRLAELSDRIWNAGTRAGTVQRALGNASEALVLARNTMPPPPPDPLTLLTSAVGAGPVPPLRAVAVGSAALFTGDATANAAKAEAVRVMRRYEATLRNSGDQVMPSAGVVGSFGRTSAVGRGVTGIPWSELVGPGGLSGVGSDRGEYDVGW